jgi:hypothetical protein
VLDAYQRCWYLLFMTNAMQHIAIVNGEPIPANTDEQLVIDARNRRGVHTYRDALQFFAVKFGHAATDALRARLESK